MIGENAGGRRSQLWRSRRARRGQTPLGDPALRTGAVHTHRGDSLGRPWPGPPRARCANPL